MRRMLGAVMLAMALCFGTAAFAADTERVTFLEGVYSVAIPEGWDYDVEDHGMVVIQKEDTVGSVLLILPPIPALDMDDAVEFAATLLDIVAGFLGGVKEKANFKGKLNDNDAETFIFDVTDEDGDGVATGGVAVVIYSGAPVIMLAMALKDDAEEFLPLAAGIMGSYEIDLGKLKEMEKELTEMGERFIEDVVKVLEEEG